MAFWGQTKAVQKCASIWAGWIGCAFLQVAQKAIVRIQFISYFLESPHQVEIKNVVKSSKHFFGYFNTLETHSL